ncbi:hypothetical protein [Neisseria sp. Ec49-e6-T10]|uniref:hypothetical protein n=1 Tax=Neisseria sp. Ec49-e6-T10 TaxID=3140744 RepID=UPI003EC155BC
MSAINNPIVNGNIVPDDSIATLDRPRVLIVGAVPAAKDAIFGSGTTAWLQKAINTSYELASAKEVANLIGTGSTYHRWEAAYNGSNQNVPIDFLLVKNTDADTATTTIEFTATPAADGTLTVDVFDGFKYFANVDFKAGDTVTTLAQAVANQLNNETVRPYTAAAAAGVVTITWVDGFVTDSTPVHVEYKDLTLACTVTHTSTPPTQPTSDLFDIIGDTRYTHILWPDYYKNTVQFAYSLLDDRFNAFNEVISGLAFTSITIADTVAAETETSTYNTKSISFVAARKIDGLFGASIGSDKKQLPDTSLAFIATAHARMLTEGADLTDLGFIAEGLDDYTGGTALASFPMHNISVPNTKPSNPAWYFDHTTQNILADRLNISTYGTNRTGTNTISGNFVTMWKTDSAGNTNLTFKQVESLFTAMAIREYWDRSARIKFANTRMTNGELISGRSMVNEQMVREWNLIVYRELADLALVTSGADAEKAFLRLLTITFSPQNQQITQTGTYEMVTHVGRIDYTIKTVFNYKD